MLPTWNWDTVNYLVANGIRVCRARTGFRDERGGSRSAANAAARGAGFGRADRGDVYRGDGGRSRPGAGCGCFRDKRSFPRHHGRLDVLKIGFFGMLAAMLVTVGNAGGVGSTVAGIARVPFIVGIDRYMPAAFGKIHPRWKTPWVSILVQAVASGAVLLISQISETTRGAYQVLIDITILIYFIPFLYMFAAVIKLAKRKDRQENAHAVLIPGRRGRRVVCRRNGIYCGARLHGGFDGAAGRVVEQVLFEAKLFIGTVAAILLGLVLYWRGVREKRLESSQGAPGAH